MSVEICFEDHTSNNITANDDYEDTSMKLDQSINKIIEKEGFIKFDINKKCVSTCGGNFLAVLHEIDVRGETADGDKELNLFVKNIMPGGNQIKVIIISEVYKSELFMYKELSKIFDELQTEYNVPHQERYKTVKSYEESSTEAIIMENLAKRGYKTYHRMEIVPLKFAEMAIKNLARFHALSFVLKVNKPDYFESEIKRRDYAFQFGDDWNAFIESSRKINLENIDEDLKDTIQKIYETIAEKYPEYYADERNKMCLCHGDYRPNNIMTYFKNGTATDLIPVDYQLIYCGCPLMDFIYFIFISTDRKFRKSHLTYLKELYFETLSTFLEYFDVKVESVFPKEEYERMYNYWLEYGLLFSVLFLPVLFADENDVPDMTADMATINFLVDGKYKNRIRDVIEDFTEWGYL